MIYMDTPKVWKEKYGPSSHLVSSQIGQAGTEELVGFARKIGMHSAWIQKKGTHHEHFDVWGSRIDRAREAGAIVISSREIALLWREKRLKMADLRPRGPAQPDRN